MYDTIPLASMCCRLVFNELKRWKGPEASSGKCHCEFSEVLCIQLLRAGNLSRMWSTYAHDSHTNML